MNVLSTVAMPSQNAPAYGPRSNSGEYGDFVVDHALIFILAGRGPGNRRRR
jgi:hypothetical protein